MNEEALEKPPIFGMIQRTGEVLIRMLENVKQVTIRPLIQRTIFEGTVVYTDEYDIYARLSERGLRPPYGLPCHV
jgi:transposase